MMLLVKNNIPTTRRIDLEDATTELLWIELSHSKGRALLGVFYRPPSSDLEYLRNLQNSLSKIPDSHNIILCGDSNVPNVNWTMTVPITPSQVATLLSDITLHSSLSQLVPDTTRNNNTLDLVLTNHTSTSALIVGQTTRSPTGNYSISRRQTSTHSGTC